MSRKNREEKERFYLLPGQGGRAYRRKRIIFLAWSFVIALIIAAIMTGIMYLVNRPAL